MHLGAKQLIAKTLAIFFLLVCAANAQDKLVVVELYTSQGCSACPPADKLMHELAKRDDVLPLALHVDYWDYIGWKDSFAHPSHADRQRAYARLAGRRSIYTPQAIIGGVDSVIGARAMELAETIEAHRARADIVDLRLTREEGDRLTISVANKGQARPMIIQVLRYHPSKSVSIKRGENAGRTITYANVVENLTPVAQWDGHARLSHQITVAGDLPIAVLVQAVNHGPILAAARLR